MAKLDEQPAPGAEALAIALAQAGLVQFGQFQQADGAFWPVTARLRMLPSYPALLGDVAAALAPLVADGEAERILCTHSAIPLGVALSLRAGLPLVYPYGNDTSFTSAFVFEGAYDVGHPTVLLADVLLDADQAGGVTELAARVGLDVTRVIAVLDLGLGARRDLLAAGFAVESLLTLAELLPVLEAAGWLPGVMRETVESWLGDFEGENG